MIAYMDSNGNIIAGVYASSPDDLNGITRVPDGCTAVYVDDTQYPDVWNNIGQYQIQNGVPVTRVFTQAELDAQLQAAKDAKLAELETAFSSSLMNGFTSTADGTSRTYPIDPISMSKLTSAHAVVNGGKIGVITIKDFNDNRVSLTADEYKQMAADGFNFYNTQEQHLWDLQDKVKAATDSATMQAIVW